MRCEAARELLVLDIYDELDPDTAARLREHLGSCQACEQSGAEERRLFGLLEPLRNEEPGADLLESCRAGLRESLGRQRGGAAIRSWRPLLRPAPALAALLLLVAGFLAGRLLPPRAGPTGGGDATPGAGGREAATIATVNDLQSDPESRRVRLRYDVLRRATLEGRASDPEIRRLLVETARGSLNSGLRLDALEALRGMADQDGVREAFLAAIREDDNPGARLKAIDALARSAPRDPEVRGAILQALLRDHHPGVRVRALDALEGARGPEMLPVLERLAREDPNDYVRLRSASYVTHAGGPEQVR